MAILDEFLFCLSGIPDSLLLKGCLLFGAFLWLLLLIRLIIRLFDPDCALRRFIRNPRNFINDAYFGESSILRKIYECRERRVTFCNWLLRKDSELRMLLNNHLQNKWEYLRILYHILVWLFLLLLFAYTVMAFVTEECSLFYAFWCWIGYFIFALIMAELHNPKLHELFWDIFAIADLLFYYYRRGIKDGLILFFEILGDCFDYLQRQISAVYRQIVYNIRRFVACCLGLLIIFLKTPNKLLKLSLIAATVCRIMYLAIFANIVVFVRTSLPQLLKIIFYVTFLLTCIYLQNFGEVQHLIIAHCVFSLFLLLSYKIEIDETATQRIISFFKIMYEIVGWYIQGVVEGIQLACTHTIHCCSIIYQHIYNILGPGSKFQKYLLVKIRITWFRSWILRKRMWRAYGRYRTKLNNCYESARTTFNTLLRTVRHLLAECSYFFLDLLQLPRISSYRYLDACIWLLISIALVILIIYIICVYLWVVVPVHTIDPTFFGQTDCISLMNQFDYRPTGRLAFL